MSTALRTQSAPNATTLLARILDEPALAEAIRELSAPELGTLVGRVGLEDAGEIVALATTEQLIGVFDEDLWRNERPGEQETFDAARFVVWLEVLQEAGDAFAAKRLAELPEDLLTLALHEQVLVLEVDALADLMLDREDREEAAQLDKALSSCLYEELDQYQLIARHPDGWDAVLSAVLALDRDHGDLLRRVLDRCVASSSEYVDDNGGLYEVLTSEEMLGEDVAADRENRRASAGYVAPSDAAAFLKLAADGTGSESRARDPITQAWFRELDRSRARPAPASRMSGGLRRILQSAGMAEPSMPLLAAGEQEPGAARARGRRGEGLGEDLVVRAMRIVAERSGALFDKRQEELAWLANVLVAGATIEGRRVRPVEAIRAAMAVIAEGLRADTGRRSKGFAAEDAASELETSTLDGLFRRGWARLHDDAARAGRKYSHDDLDLLQERGVSRKPRKTSSKASPAKTPRRSRRG